MTAPDRSVATEDSAAALVADVERDLSVPLHKLVAAVVDDDSIDTVTRARLDAAAKSVSDALRQLALIHPARRDHHNAVVEGSSTVARTGGLGSNSSARLVADSRLGGRGSTPADPIGRAPQGTSVHGREGQPVEAPPVRGEAHALGSDAAIGLVAVESDQRTSPLGAGACRVPPFPAGTGTGGAPVPGAGFPDRQLVGVADYRAVVR